MDASAHDPEKATDASTSGGPSTANSPDLSTLPVRTVNFPDQGHEHEHDDKQPRGVELRQHMTQEEIQLAAAGYEHLEQEKKGKDDADDSNVDIKEHQLSLVDLAETLKTSFEPKNPSASYGLTADDAATRLKTDGPNMLTPPKKKSALRKARHDSDLNLLHKSN